MLNIKLINAIKKNTDIEYAHVDNINIFRLIDDIYKKPNNNPIFSFEKYNEIEEWLRDQWAGLFKDFLIKRGNIKKLESLQSQIRHLETLNLTLKNYLEVLLYADKNLETQNIIQKENEKISKSQLIEHIHNLFIVSYLFDGKTLNSNQIEELISILKMSKNPFDFIHRLSSHLPISSNSYSSSITHLNDKNMAFLNDINELRTTIGLLSKWKYI